MCGVLATDGNDHPADCQQCNDQAGKTATSSLPEEVILRDDDKPPIFLQGDIHTMSFVCNIIERCQFREIAMPFIQKGISASQVGTGRPVADDHEILTRIPHAIPSPISDSKTIITASLV
jgi:hypothetical protein